MEEANAVAAALLALGGVAAEPDGAGPQRQADEVREIGRRLVRNLTRAPFRSYSGAPQGSILVAEALRPSDAALIDPARIAGVATEEGGTDGHTAIILRALGIPSVLGAPGLLAGTAAGRHVVVDGSGGRDHAATRPPRAWPRRAARSRRSRASGSGSAGCAGCPR